MKMSLFPFIPLYPQSDCCCPTSIVAQLLTAVPLMTGTPYTAMVRLGTCFGSSDAMLQQGWQVGRPGTIAELSPFFSLFFFSTCKLPVKLGKSP
jgi:hypothetical protein